MKSYFSKEVFKNAAAILKNAGKAFSQDRALKFSASLAYYAMFSMAPLLILLISLASIFLGKEAIQGKVSEEISGLVGNQVAAQIQRIIRQVEQSGQTTISSIIGITALLIGAVTLFREIQDSINIIWKVAPATNKSWYNTLKEHLWSYLLMLFLSSLFVLSLIGYGVLLAVSDKLKVIFPQLHLNVFNIVNVFLSFIVITVLFAAIYKVLPEAKISWKYVRWGAIFTALLFMFGRFLIGIYIQKSATGSAYGAAGSLIVILLWVYYSAAVLYFGAEFIKAYADFKETEIIAD